MSPSTKQLKGRQNKAIFEGLRSHNDKFGVSFGESRMSPWGLQRFRKGEDSGAWFPFYGDWPSRVRGRWIRHEPVLQCKNHGGKSDCLGYHARLTVPSKEEWDAFSGNEVIDPQYDTADRAGDAYPVVESSGRDMLSRMPPEIILQILGHLVPRGCAFQFFAGNREKEPVQVIQQLVRSDGQGPRSAHMALAATNQRFRELMYDLIYGRNTFVFNIGIAKMGANMESHVFNRFESWVKLLRKGSTEPLGPITQATAGYLRTAVLLVVYPLMYNSEIRNLTEVVESATQKLSNTVFDKLTIHITSAPRIDQRYKHLWIDVIDVDFNEETDRVEVAVRDPVLDFPRRELKIQQAFEPLLNLRVNGKADVSGTMAEDFFRRLTEGGPSGN